MLEATLRSYHGDAVKRGDIREAGRGTLAWATGTALAWTFFTPLFMRRAGLPLSGQALASSATVVGGLVGMVAASQKYPDAYAHRKLVRALNDAAVSRALGSDEPIFLDLNRHAFVDLHDLIRNSFHRASEMAGQEAL